MSNEPSDRSDAPPAPTEAALRAELEHAQANLARLESEYAELLADPGVIQEDRDSTRRLLEGARITAVAAERAVARFEDGTYGRCVRCGGAIAPERLEAIPDAELCVSCSR
ncbi:MAG: TraR/DksA family transcriptional regulator [Ilumatobacteraceae bacterium]